MCTHEMHACFRRRIDNNKRPWTRWHCCSQMKQHGSGAHCGGYCVLCMSLAHREQQSVSFMYNKPPGMRQPEGGRSGAEEEVDHGHQGGLPGHHRRHRGMDQVCKRTSTSVLRSIAACTCDRATVLSTRCFEALLLCLRLKTFRSSAHHGRGARSAVASVLTPTISNL